MIGLSLSLSLRHSITISVQRSVSRHAHARAPTPNTLHSAVEGATVPTADRLRARSLVTLCEPPVSKPRQQSEHTVGKQILVAFFLLCPKYYS